MIPDLVLETEYRVKIEQIASLIISKTGVNGNMGQWFGEVVCRWYEEVAR